jgi:pimeloyl-ACP methyl ester carboxylesterase
MPTASINGVQLYYEMHAHRGEPLVLVHGSWGDHQNWAAIVPLLIEHFQVVTYDRRGHSRSERPASQGSVREDVADLAALIEHLGIGPAHIMGNSFGASIALGLAGARPELFRSLIAHEPPLLGLLSNEPTLQPLLREATQRTNAVLALLRQGDLAGGAVQFVETVAVGPGGWAQLPVAMQETAIHNAPTWLDEMQDPDWLAIDLAVLGRFPHRALLTHGDQSPPFFPAIVGKLATATSRAELRHLAGVGHIPHVSHPTEYAQLVRSFIADTAAA